MIVRQIEEEELSEFSALLQEVVQWLHATGKPLWSEKCVSPEELLKTYSLDELYLGFEANEPIATMALRKEDPRFWPNANAGEALYLHKLSVKRAFAGKGFADEMVKWAANHVASIGRSYLRLDCDCSRLKLRSFYERLGFEFVDRRPLDGFDLAFFELKVS